jgi:uncharacterized protein (TIGR01244 family)
MPGKFKRLADSYWVAPQLTSDDVKEAAAMGVALIVNNRPDGEEPGQPTSAEIEEAALAAGLDYVSIPFVRANVTDAQVAELEAAVANAKGPILAYCRSGTRSTAIRALALAKAGRNIAEVIDEAADAGYDLSSLRPRLEAMAARR